MLSSLKRLTKHSAVYGIGNILARSIGFLLLPLHTNYLPPAEFGVSGLVFAYLAILTIAYTYGVDAAFLRYYILADDPAERKRIFSTAFLTILVSTIGFSLLGYIFASQLAVVVLNEPHAGHLIQLCSGILFFDALAILPFLILRADEKSRQFVVLKILNGIINIAMNYVMIVMLGKGVTGIFVANLLASAFTFLTIAPIIVRNLAAFYSGSTLKYLVAFGLPYLPSTLAVGLIEVLGRYILERMTSKAVLGIYNSGYKLGMIMALIVTAFRFAWHPFFLATAKEARAKEIFAKVLTYFALICSLVFLVISYFIDDFIQIKVGSAYVFGKEYWSSTSIVPIVMLAYIFYGVYLNFLVGIYLEKKTGYLPFITGAGLVANIAGNLLLIPVFGMFGSAWATVLSYLVMAVALYAVAQRLYPVQYEFGRLIKLAVVIGIYFGINYWLTPSLLLKLGVLLTLPVALYLAGFLETRELERIKGLIPGLSRQ